MIQAIVWKEFREQGLIGLTLLVLGSGVLVAAAVLADPPTDGASLTDVLRFVGAGRLATLLLAVTAGTVCGGALFAAEREAGTLGFLDALPASRWDLWVGKLAAGAALVVCQVVPLLGLAGLLGLVESARGGFQLGLSALHAFVWGMYGSTVARTTLGSVGVAIPSAVLAAVVYAVPVFLLFHHPRTNMLRPEGGLLLTALMFATPLAMSAYLFTRPDRDRTADDPSPARSRTAYSGWDPAEAAVPAPARRPADDRPPRRGPRVGVQALVWLSARQLLVPGLVGSAFALGFGLVLLVPEVQPVMVWPPLALAAGVLAGVTVFADEQARGSARFWGERRLPVGRAWAVKVAVHAAFAVWLLALLALPAAVRWQAAADDLVQPETALAGVFRTRLFEAGHLGAQGWKLLLLPAAYGFAAGHLCGLLFKKAVVATGVAGLLGGTAAALWVPSLLAGGVYHWQLWLPVAAVVLTARVLMRPWAADRVPTRGPLTALAGGVAAALLVLAAGVGFRAVEVPDDPAGEDDQRYVAGLPTIENNKAGTQFRSAADGLGRAAEAVAVSVRGPDGRPPPGGAIEARLERVPADGLGADASALNQWLDGVFGPRLAGASAEGPWYALAAAAAREPTGQFEPPLLVSGTPAGVATMEHGRRMGAVLVARGLQRQRAGDPAAFVDHLGTALALGRNLRNGSGVAALRHGQTVARHALLGADRWLRELDGRPDLVRRAAAAVLADDRAVPTRWADGRVVPPAAAADGEEVPFDPTPHLLADRYVVRELQKAPGGWLPDQITPPGLDREASVPIADLVGFGWATPWERERTRRLVGLGPDRRAGLGRLIRGRPGAGMLARVPNPADLVELDRQLRALRRGTLLKLAVRAYQAEHGGAPPPDLAALVPGYLPAVPRDPYDGAPFRYRVARAGDVPPPGVRQVQAVQDGQPLVWSVGTDRKDDGGWSEPFAGGDARRDDYVFPVPAPPPPKRP